MSDKVRLKYVEWSAWYIFISFFLNYILSYNLENVNNNKMQIGKKSDENNERNNSVCHVGKG